MRVVRTLARILNPWVWRSPEQTARKLHEFALAEHGSMLDLRLAARATPSPTRAAAYLRHADDEARHMQMFAKRATQLAREHDPSAPQRSVRADCEQLFANLGELDFLAFVHLGESRAIVQFRVYVAYFERQGRARDASLLTTILVDEDRHAAYTKTLLTELAGGQAQATRALRRVRRWELWRRWLRSGRFLAERVYVLTMLLVYALAAPMALVIRWARPLPQGWQIPETAAALPSDSSSSASSSPSSPSPSSPSPTAD